MENTLVIVSIIGGIIGTITGVLGLTFTVISNKRHAQEKAEERERHAQELERHAQERAEEKERHAQELERHAQERAEEKEMHAQELEMHKQEKVRSDRLMFLADRIFDSSIPRELRQPFYEEYISMKGNGTAVRFWLLEAEREKKTKKPA
jgi:serine phosphatase RsbU (regulator of sigma subunit)